MRAEMVQTTNNCRSGAIRLRSSASLVTIACFALRAQTTTWASTTSAVPVRASNRPTVVASGPSSRIRSVSICRISRDRRACLAGLRMACASAVAVIVNAHPTLFCARNERQHPAIIPVQGDQPTRVERDTAQAAFPFRTPLFCLSGERSVSAQSRSFSVNGPPVC